MVTITSTTGLASRRSVRMWIEFRPYIGHGFARRRCNDSRFLTWVKLLDKAQRIWGRCHDFKFLRFSPIFGEKIGVFLKHQCYDQIFAKLSSVLSQKRQYCCQIFWRKYLKNHNIGPWMLLGSGLPDVSWYNVPKREKIYQITTKYTKCP
jgi:hypothetical protein